MTKHVLFCFLIVVICIGDHAFDIQASDPEGDKLTYRISGIDAAVFEVTPETGRVTMKGSLDREV